MTLKLLPLVLAVLALAGCGNPPPSPTATAATPAPTTYPFKGDVYGLRVPASWVDKTQDAATYNQVVRTSEGTGLLVLIHPVSGTYQPGVNDVEGNIVVLQRNDPVPDDQLSTFAGQPRKGVANLTGPTTMEIDGEVGYLITYEAPIDQTPGETEEALFNHEGRTYEVSLTTSKFAFQSEQSDLTSLLQSWKWTS